MAAACFPGGAPRLVALDLDGTLLTSDKRVSARSRAAVGALVARGVTVMLCTGRPPRSSRAYAAELGLTDPYICFNGAAVYHPATGALAVRHHLEPGVAREALARLRNAFPTVGVGLESDHGWYLEPEVLARREAEARLGPGAPTDVGPAERFIDAGAIKLLASAEGRSAAELAEAVAALPVGRTWSAGGLLELLDPRVDKGAALAERCSVAGIDRRAVAAFGDQRNDVEMIRWAGFGVAVANASEEVRAAADHVAGSNDDDGVAAVLESWCGAPTTDAAHRPPTNG